jgi:hypothetical protein
MFELRPIGSGRGALRLLATSILSPDDFDRIAALADTAPFRARKIGLISARRTLVAELVITHWNGTETENAAVPGDYIVTNLSEDRTPLLDGQGHTNTYVIAALKFFSLYEPVVGGCEEEIVYKSRGIVDALYLAGGFDILAPWGHKQVGAVGYLIRNGDDVYGNNKETFEATYERVLEPAG